MTMINQKRAIEVEAVLHITSITFPKDKKWDFIYDGNRISDAIYDSQFNKRILDREYSLNTGDILNVRLQIMQKFSQKGNTYINTSYRILEVYKHPIF